jgi:hypothetical protein
VEVWAEAIISGDIETLRQYHFQKTESARKWTLRAGLLPKPKYSQKVVNFRGPTILIWAIECEQVEVLEYLFGHIPLQLDAVSRDGLTALHVAAHVGDPRPLEFLLRYRFFQEQIDFPVHTEGLTQTEAHFTTALHIAVTQRNVPHVFLLLNPRDKWELLTKPKPWEPPPEPLAPHNPANVDQPSANGATPLHIAIHNGHLAMVRVLIAHNADPTKRDGSDLDALSLATKVEAEKRRIRFRAARNAERKLITAYLKEEHNEAVEEVMDELAPEIARVEVAGPADAHSDNDDESSDGPAEAPPAEALAAPQTKRTRRGDVAQLTELVRGLQRSITHLEAQWRATGGGGTVLQTGQCGGCSGPAELCAQCHGNYCNVCAHKSVHPCADST